ncbi:MAG: zinc-dependent alcohol dehydrogenase family protein [Limisphaera sp.]|nr:zinc-dependent alcohol dehydrogenase family protein [Limisphaera sp.]
MVLEQTGRPLRADWVPRPEPGSGQVLVRILSCAVCRTDLHIVDGELPQPKLPLIPGHQIVGEVVAVGPHVQGLACGDRVGIGWLGGACGRCRDCQAGRENLCDCARFTGYTLDGGYAEYTVADARYCFRLSGAADPVHLAPLLCAGLIGYRCLRKAGEAQALGLYGFGAAAHLICQVATFQGRRVYAFTRPGDRESQQFALNCGAVWAGDSDQPAPELLDAAIIFAPVGALIPMALRAVRKGGTVICGGIHMTDIPSFPYRDLWGERTICSVANLTRQDGLEFLQLAESLDLHVSVRTWPLHHAGEALNQLRSGRMQGAAVLVP